MLEQYVKLRTQIYVSVSCFVFVINFWGIKQSCSMFQSFKPLSSFDNNRLKTDMNIHHDYSSENSFGNIFL